MINLRRATKIICYNHYKPDNLSTFVAISKLMSMNKNWDDEVAATIIIPYHEFDEDTAIIDHCIIIHGSVAKSAFAM